MSSGRAQVRRTDSKVRSSLVTVVWFTSPGGAAGERERGMEFVARVQKAPLWLKVYSLGVASFYTQLDCQYQSTLIGGAWL